MRIVGSKNWIGELPLSVQAKVRERQVVRNIQVGETICQAGEAARYIHQVEDGCVKLVSDLANGERALIAIYIRGNCFTETAVVSARNLKHTTVAAIPSKVAFLAKQDFDELFLAYPEISQSLCRKFAQTITRSVHFRDVKADFSLHEQLRIVFHNLAESTGQPNGGERIKIPVPLTISELSSFLGVTRQTVQKEITTLKKQGILYKEQGLWIVADKTQLAANVPENDLGIDRL